MQGETLNNLADGALVIACLDGNDQALGEIVRRYERPLLRVAQSRLFRADWAEDVVQETFLCVVKSLHTYDSRYSFRTWLWTILLYQCRRQAIRAARRPQVHNWSDAADSEDELPLDSRLQSDAAPPASLAMARERTALLQRLLFELPDTQADALRLRFFGELKFQEIADAMGCSLSTAKNRVRKGLITLSQMLVEEEARSEAKEGHAW